MRRQQAVHEYAVRLRSAAAAMAAGCAFVLTSVAPVQGTPPQEDGWFPALVNTEIMVLENGLALGGYDPVAYFEQGEAQLGDEEISLEWRGATWVFASAAHRELFRVAPEDYAPQYGGWCAYGASGHGEEGYGAQSRPSDSWSIIDGKLYLNWNPDVVEWFRADEDQLIRAADRQWPDLSEGIRSGDPVHWQTVPRKYRESERRLPPA
ncbi:MAG: YHS domain-containing protein [Acidobacteria bacterium]|nr:YHS domain-containing protein [Acidobacteriota bacterium]